MLRILLLLAMTLSPLLATADEPAPDWKTEIELGKKALAAHDYTAGLARFQAALRGAPSAPGDESGRLESLRGCATVARLLGRFEQAGQFLAQAVAPAARLYGGASLDLAAILSDLAAVERSRGESARALEALQKAVAIRESHAGEVSQEFARDLTSLALLQLAAPDPKPARETLIRALAAWDAVAAPDSPQLLPVLDALSGVYRDTAEYDQAEILLLRALMIREAASGPDSAELLATLDSLAYVYFGEKKYADAEPVYRRLLSLWESSAGPAHPMVALTLDKMAEFYAFQQRYDEAEKAATAALAIRSDAYLLSLNQTGRVLLMEARLGEAEDLYRRAISIADLQKASDERLDPLLRVYGKVLRALDRTSEADAIDKRAKDALLRKADREGRRPSPVKFPAAH